MRVCVCVHVCVCVCMFMCVCYHLTLETTRFHYSEKLSMEGMGCKRSELQGF